MTGIYIFLTLLVIIAFILTRTVIVNVKKADRLRIEIHFPILALILTSRDKHDKDKNHLTLRQYRLLAGDISDISKKSHVIIRKLVVGGTENSFNAKTFLRPFRIYSLLSAAVAYLFARAQRLTLADNAFDFKPDRDGVTFDLGASMPLFTALVGAIRIIRTVTGKRGE